MDTIKNEIARILLEVEFDELNDREIRIYEILCRAGYLRSMDGLKHCGIRRQYLHGELELNNTMKGILMATEKYGWVVRGSKSRNAKAFDFLIEIGALDQQGQATPEGVKLRSLLVRQKEKKIAARAEALTPNPETA